MTTPREDALLEELVLALNVLDWALPIVTNLLSTGEKPDAFCQIHFWQRLIDWTDYIRDNSAHIFNACSISDMVADKDGFDFVQERITELLDTKQISKRR